MVVYLFSSVLFFISYQGNIEHLPRDNSQNDSIILFPKRDQRSLSLHETVVKREEDLRLARQTIKNLQSHLGTVVLSGDSESDGVISTDEGDVLQAEVTQNDSFFAHEYRFKTNVRKPI